jgi:hypothetical protein
MWRCYGCFGRSKYIDWLDVLILFGVLYGALWLLEN